MQEKNMQYTGKEQAPRRQFLSVAEAEATYGPKQVWWRKQIATRQIECVRFGRSVRIPVEAIERMIAENTVPAR